MQPIDAIILHASGSYRETKLSNLDDYKKLLHATEMRRLPVGDYNYYNPETPIRRTLAFYIKEKEPTEILPLNQWQRFIEILTGQKCDMIYGDVLLTNINEKTRQDISIDYYITRLVMRMEIVRRKNQPEIVNSLYNHINDIASRGWDSVPIEVF
jgi:hypothetical protein